MFAKSVWNRNSVIFLFVLNLFVLFAGNAFADSPYYSKCEGGYSPPGAVSQPPDYNLCYQRYFEIKEYAENPPANGISAEKPSNSSGFIFNGSPCLAGEYVISFNTDVSSTNGDDFELVSTHPVWDSLIYLNLSDNPLSFGPFKIDWGNLPFGWLSTKGIYKLTYGYQQRSTLYSSSYSNMGRYYACVPSKFQVLFNDDLKSVSQILKSNFDETQYCEKNVAVIADTTLALKDIRDILVAAKKANFNLDLIKEILRTGNYSPAVKEFFEEIIENGLLEPSYQYFAEKSLGENVGDSIGESLGWALCSTDSLWVAPIEGELMEQIDNHLFLVPKNSLFPVTEDKGVSSYAKVNNTPNVSVEVKWLAPKVGSADHLILYKASQHKTNGQPTLVDAYPLKVMDSGDFTENIQCHGINGVAGDVTFDYWITTANGKSWDTYNQNGKFASTHSKWAYLGPVTLPACTTNTQVSVANYPNCGANNSQFACDSPDSGSSSDSSSNTGGGNPVPSCTIDPATKGVILYSGVDYTGSCMLATTSIASFAGLPVGDNAVSSVRVNGDFRVRFYEDQNFVGLDGRYHEANSSQSNLDIETLGNQISSAQIVEIVKCSETKDGVYLYKDAKFDGSCYYTTGDVSDLGSTPVGDNSLSSIKIVGDYETKPYEDKGFAGRSEPIHGSDDNLNDHSLGEQYSSIKVWKKTECKDLSRRGVYVYSNYNYQGNCVFVAYGSPNPNFGDIVAMDHVRSFILVGVDCIKLYEYPNYGGRADRVCSNKVKRDYNYRIWGIEAWMRPMPLPPPNSVIFNTEGGAFDIGYSNYSAVKISVAVNGNATDIKYRPDCFKPIGVFDTLVDPDLQVSIHNHLGYPNWRTEAQDEIPGNGRFDWNLGMDQLGVNNAVVGELYCNIVAWDAKQGIGENTETEMADANGYMYTHVTVNQTLAAPVYVRQCLLPANGQVFDIMPDLCWNNPTGYKLLFDLFKKSPTGQVTQILGINWTNTGKEAIPYNEAGVYGIRYGEMNMSTKKWFYYNGGAISWFTVKNPSTGTGLARSLGSDPALEQSPSYVTSLYLPLVVTDASTSVETPQSEEQIQQSVEIEEKQPADAKPIEQSTMTVQIFLPIVAN